MSWSRRSLCSGMSPRGLAERVHVAVGAADLIEEGVAGLAVGRRRVGLRRAEEHGERDQVEEVVVAQLRVRDGVVVGDRRGRRRRLVGLHHAHVAARSVSPARAPPTPFDDALGTGRRAFISSGSGSLVMPRWLKSGPRMKPSIETVCDLRPKRPTKPWS